MADIAEIMNNPAHPAHLLQADSPILDTVYTVILYKHFTIKAL